MDSDLLTIVEKAVKQAHEERGHVNIMIAGPTGVGKSTLINAIFQENLTETGNGRPVTMNTKEITKQGIPVSIFDTRGIETAQYDATMKDLEKFLKERNTNHVASQHIHVAWICISEDCRRVQESDEELVKRLANFMPVIVVITKAHQDVDSTGKSFRSTVEEMLPLVRNVVRVRAIQTVDDEDQIKQPMGLDKLVDLTMTVVPEAVQKAFVAAQKVNTQLKIDKSHGVVAIAATGAAAACAIPIPFAETVVLVPIQVAMIAKITSIFGLSFDVSSVTSTIGGMVASAGGTLGTRTIASGLLQLIPGAGTLAGSIISAATAVTLTTALGETYISTLNFLFEKEEGKTLELDEVTETFKKNLTKAKAPEPTKPLSAETTLITELVEHFRAVPGITNASEGDFVKAKSVFVFNDGTSIRTWTNPVWVQHVFIANTHGKCEYSGFVGWVHSAGLQQAIDIATKQFH